MNQNWSRLGPQQNLVVEGWGCLVGGVTGVGWLDLKLKASHILQELSSRANPRGWGCGRHLQAAFELEPSF